MSFLNELRRRNVFRVGVAYLVGAWLLLQLTEVLSELLSLPSEVGPVVVVAVLIGLPITLIVAWVYEITPEGIRKEKDVDRGQSITGSTGRKLNAAIVIMLILALTYFIWESRFSVRSSLEDQAEPVTSQAQTSPAPPAPAPSEQIDPQSIAVLPFDNRSTLEEDEFFVEGIHDDLLTTLARIGSMKVISRTSVSTYANTEKTIPQIAAELGVATIMEGAVQRSGNMVRINVQLIDAQSDEHLWAEIFDRELTTENLFAIQSEISEQIAVALQAALTAEEVQRLNERPTDNLEAYNAYLLGRQLAIRRNADDLDKALEQFRLAIKLDPEFAQAWSGLAFAARWASNYGGMPYSQANEIVLEASEKALELNPELGEPWLIRASFKEASGQYTEAEADYLKALDLSPNSALAHHWYANYLDDSSARLSEAYVHALRATELNPMSSIDQLELADLFQKLGEFEQAEIHIRQVIERDPEFATAYQYMGLLKEETGRFDEQLVMSIKSQELNPRDPRLILDEIFARANMDDNTMHDSLRERLVDKAPNGPFAVMLDTFMAIRKGNPTGALESALSLRAMLGEAPFYNNTLGAIFLMNERYEESREAFEKSDPRLRSRDTWEAAYKESVSQACTIAWLMIKTGEPELGLELVNHVITYFENELPNYLKFPERYDATVCYLTSDQYEKAVALTVKRLDNNFTSNWWLNKRNPLMAPVWEDPRVYEALQRMHEDLARQREKEHGQRRKNTDSHQPL